jgi:hypothetical protein
VPWDFVIADKSRARPNLNIDTFTEGITDNGRVYSMSHLQPFTHVFRVDEVDITIHFTFGFHCFTDEKDEGKQIFNRGERRYFSPSRWEVSKELKPLS